MSKDISKLGQALLDRVRQAINEEWGDYAGLAPEWELECDQCGSIHAPDSERGLVASATCPDCGEGTLQTTEPFVVTFLRSRDGCVPDEYLNEEDVKDSIIQLFGFVFWNIAEAIQDATGGVYVWTCIEPNYMGETRVVMYTVEPRALLLLKWEKAWNLHWESEEEMAKDLESWYTEALTALKQAQTPRQVTVVVPTICGILDEDGIKAFASEDEALAALEEWAKAEGFTSYADYQAHAAWTENDAYVRTVAVQMGSNDEQQVTVSVPIGDDYLQNLDLWRKTGSTPQTPEEALADYLRFLAVYVKNRESEEVKR